jgi:hypothetical protein
MGFECLHNESKSSAFSLGDTLKELLNSEHRALFLLLSVLLFFALTPFLQDSHGGEGFLVGSIYVSVPASSNHNIYGPILEFRFRSLPKQFGHPQQYEPRPHRFREFIGWLLAVTGAFGGV